MNLQMILKASSLREFSTPEVLQSYFMSEPSLSDVVRPSFEANRFKNRREGARGVQSESNPDLRRPFSLGEKRKL